jgi:AICAR transformylase/IMP cyclohydrolase PurH
MSLIPLRLRFLFLSLCVLGGVLVLSRSGSEATEEITKMTGLREIVTLTKLQGRIDMMHDAIHGNILQALSEAARGEDVAETQMNINSLKSGLYFYTVKVNDTKITSGKITIINK